MIAIPRISLLWLLVAQVLVVLPHLLHLPLWVVPLWLGCAGWRIQIFRMRAGYPSSWVKGSLLVLVCIGVFFSHGSLLGLSAGTVLLIAAFLLKLLEMRTRRDALVLIYLGFFAITIGFLFNDSMLMALYCVLPVIGLLAALIGLQQSAFAARPWPTLRLATGLLLQAAPLMVLLFLFFPRLGPIWSMPLPSNKAQVGLSDSMSPGDIAQLSLSPELVFRASFDGPLPDRRDLYWRALTLEHFDGRRWSQSSLAQLAGVPAWDKRGSALRYSIVMQPSSRPWLYSLDVAETQLDQTRQMSDFRLERRRPVETSLFYQVTSWPEVLREPDASIRLSRRGLQLPIQGNPRSRQLAAELKAQHPQAEALVAALLQHFNREPFVYTLKPPRLGDDSIDEFLFVTRRGFCEHYAGAMTFVLRAAGIPARVVTGYQGGEVANAGKYVQVRQFDAHAWVEYWRPQQGWTTIDPTFQVAPQRIEQGLEQALVDEESFLQDSPFAALRYRKLGWLNNLQKHWDDINYGWDRWVLGYQFDQQSGLMQRWFGQRDSRLLAAMMVGGCALLLGLVALFLFRPWARPKDMQQRLFLRFERLLAQQGVWRSPGEGPRAFAARAVLRLPSQAAAINAFAQAFEAQRYAGSTGSVAELRHLLKRLRTALPWRLMRPGQDVRGETPPG
ncbi:MAG: DUF3488 and transglutaminase-like domain-containing protein [Pseudomonas sp.]|uniref:transglutaminase TgpA family protein n=1 Tax=Pseudomonas sp. TaxID=306 RepID=UPI003395D148